MKNVRSLLKVATILGTRPEIIRLSMVMTLLDKYVNHIIVHTGQNYDYELNEIFFNDLEIRKPDFYLDVNTSSLGTVYGDTIIKSEHILKREKPDAVLLLGDTNSCIAGIIAKRLRIPIYHMEAGNRCFDFNVPEEINRMVIDHIADFNLVYTEHARRHLISEGLPHRGIYLTGSPMYEVLNYYKDKIEKSDILNRLNLKQEEYFIVSIHREENVDNEKNLAKIITTLNSIVENYNKPVIVTTHPRTRKHLERLKNCVINNHIKFLPPFGYTDYIKLQKNAICVISDSGTISEESAILKFPAVTLRNSMERPEALDAGTIILTGLEETIILDSINLAIEKSSTYHNIQIPPEYEIENTSWRVVQLILGTAKLSNLWNGINQIDY